MPDIHHEMVEFAAEGLIYQEAGGEIKVWNQAAARIFGLEADQALGQTSTSRDWGLIFEDGSPCPGDQHPSMITLTTGEPLTNQIRGIKRNNGQVTWLSINTRPVFDEGGGLPRAVIVSFTEVTESKIAPDNFEKSEARLQPALEAASIGLWDLDLQTMSVHFSPTWFAMLGFEPDELPSTFDTWSGLLHPEDRERVLARVSETFEGSREDYLQTFRMRTKSGDYRRVLGNGRVMTRDSQGKPLRLLGAHVDISELKADELSFREREETFRTLVNTAPYGIQFTDLEGKIVHGNPAHHRMLGYQDGELIGRYSWELMADDNRRARARQDYELIIRERPTPVVYYSQVITRDGRLIDTQIDWDYVHDSHGDLQGIISVISDITERKRTEEMLKANYLRQKIAMDLAKLVHWEYDVDADQFTFDDQFYALYATSASEQKGGVMSSGEYARRFLPPEDQVVVANEVALARETEDPDFMRQLEHRIIRSDGQERFISVRFGIIKDETGRTIKTYGANQDITERKRAEKALAVERAQLLSIFDSIDEVIYVTDPDTYEILYVNQAMKDAFQKEFIGGICYREFQGFDSPCEFCTNEIIFNQKRAPYKWEYHNPVLQRDFSVVDRVIKWPDGRDVRFEIAIDITERKRAEEALRESEEKYRLLVENAGEAIFITQEGFARFSNYRALEMTGYSAEELAGMPFVELIHPDERDMILDRSVRRHRGEKIPDAYTLRIITKGGDTIWGQISAAVITWRGRPATLCFIKDITEQKTMENQLAQAQKMEAVGQLAGGVAHDFNNLMTIINGFGQMALDRLDSRSPAYQDIEEVIRAGERATSLTRQLLAFSRKQILTPKVVDVNAIVANMEKMLHRLIGEDIEMSINLQEGLGPIHVDPGQVEQIILNLAVNARDAMPTGGKLTIETANADLDEHYISQHPDMEVTPGPHTLLSISDNGPGMDKEVLGKIFEPFFTTKGRAESTGLGLSTVYGIVKQSGGDINVYSGPGQGTTFIVYFRQVAQSEPVGEGERPSARSGAAGETLLVVEDDEGVRDFISRTLTEVGYRVLSAAGGHEAIGICQEQDGRIDLLLTDVVMPEMSGRELADRLAGQYPAIKVLFMSGYTDNVIARHGVLERGVAFISKPFSVDGLTRKLREVLEGSSIPTG